MRAIRSRTYDRPVADMAGTCRLIDLFAGCGGHDAWVRRHRPVRAGLRGRDGRRCRGDVRGELRRCPLVVATIEDVESFPTADVVIGGPPCQGFSPLNRDAVGLSAELSGASTLRALRESGADVFVMENVPELLRSAEYGAFKAVAENSSGSRSRDVLNAADYGVPQTAAPGDRHRSRTASISWPAPTHHDPEKLPLAASLG